MATQGRLFGDDMPPPRAVAPRQRGHEAAARSARRAGAVWTERAAVLVLDFAAGMVGTTWLMEDAREWAEACKLPAPPDKRAWGAVTTALQKRGQIVASGYASARSSNGSPKVLWRRVA